MQSIMGCEIAYTFRRSDLGIDRTSKSGDGLFRFAAISQFGYVPDDLLFVCPLFRGIFIPPENPNVWNAFVFELKETSLLKSAHTSALRVQSVTAIGASCFGERLDERVTDVGHRPDSES